MANVHAGQLVGSPLEYLPVIEYVQSRFDMPKALKWLHNYWYFSVIGSAVYLMVVYFGRRWMSTKSPYKLRRPLVMWNVGLAVFSMLGAISLFPNLIHSIIKYGISYSVCHTECIINPHLSLWAYIFVLSKVPEFGDTFFIILRKSPLVFLHWYHHITVCMYSWYGLGHSNSAIGVWFASMNFTVHSVMYSYYAFKAAGVKVPSRIALLITIMQIAQMFIALFVFFGNYFLHNQEDVDCEFNRDIFNAGLIVYGSYAILFLHYFYRRYCSKKSKTD